MFAFLLAGKAWGLDNDGTKITTNRCTLKPTGDIKLCCVDFSIPNDAFCIVHLSVLMYHKLNHKCELKIRIQRQHQKILRIKVVFKFPKPDFLEFRNCGAESVMNACMCGRKHGKQCRYFPSLSL